MKNARWRTRLTSGTRGLLSGTRSHPSRIPSTSPRSPCIGSVHHRSPRFNLQPESARLFSPHRCATLSPRWCDYGEQQVRFEVARLKDVQYRFSVTAQDAAGNAASPVVFEWMVDTVAPETVCSPPSSLRRRATACIVANTHHPQRRKWVLMHDASGLTG